MANPTTNFAWVMPVASDLVTGLPTQFATFGQAVDTSMQYLLGGTTGQVLSKTSGTNMAFTWTAAGMSNPLTTTGDIIYSSSGTTAARLPIGSSGKVLSVSGGLPAWTTAATGGKVLQVVMGTTSTSTSNATNTFQNTTLTANITPTLNTSKVLILISHNGIYKSQAAAANRVNIKLLRDSTALDTFIVNSNYTNTAIELSVGGSYGYLDAPASTSAITYKTQFMNPQNTATATVQSDGAMSSIILLEIGA